MVEDAWSAIVDPEVGIFGDASGVAEFTWLVNHAEESPAATTSANNPLTNDLPWRLSPGQNITLLK